MPNDQSRYINARQLRDRYGGVSHMWVERKLADDPEFPKPVYLGARRCSYRSCETYPSCEVGPTPTAEPANGV